MLLPLLFATAVALPSGLKTTKNGLKGQQLVDFLNQNQEHFKAEFNPISEEKKKLRVMSISRDVLKMAKSLPAPEITTLKDADIPTSFDSRTAWPNCPSISFIRDQAQCGSCWAVASASVISDRTCIASNGTNLFTASADDIMSCCTDCGFGCNGGIPLIAMEWWHHIGVVTGGEYQSGEGCKPYPYGYPSYHNETTPQCTSTCQPNYSKSYSEDKHFGGLFYEVPPTVTGIQKEIMTHGPVVACFEEYDDFNYYKTGVYVHTAGDYVGLHCTRVIGWGVENGTPYWLGANSWGRSFGDNGFYKIIRGIDECGYESVMATGRARA